jgi:hypothetical protein
MPWTITPDELIGTTGATDIDANAIFTNLRSITLLGGARAGRKGKVIYGTFVYRNSALGGLAADLTTLANLDGATGQFILLPGVASLAAGDVVTWYYDAATALPIVIRATSTTYANQGAPLAVSLTANTSTTSYSWYQIQGPAVVNNNGTWSGANARVSLTTTAGQLSTTMIAGSQLLNARSSSTISFVATNQAILEINNPTVQTQIT